MRLDRPLILQSAMALCPPDGKYARRVRSTPYSRVGIAGHHFTIDHRCLGQQLMQQLRDGRKTLSEVMPVAAVEDDDRANLVGLHAVAIELHLVRPVVAGGPCLGGDGAARLDEAELGHDLRM